MEIREYINTIVENGRPEDMDKLAVMLEELMEETKEHDHESYCEYKEELYVMAYGKHLTKEKAEQITKEMKPKGEHWTIEQTTQVKNQYGLAEINDVDFYIVMNMAYNDYYDLFNENLDYYVKFTKDFIQDEDAPEGKTYLYFMRMHD